MPDKMPDYFFTIHYRNDHTSKQEEFVARRCTMVEAWDQVVEYAEDKGESVVYADVKCHNTGEHRRINYI